MIQVRKLCSANLHKWENSTTAGTLRPNITPLRNHMPSIDMPLEQLRQYKPPLYREADFESFWESTTAEAVKQPINAELIPYDLRTKGLVCYAVRFDGYRSATAPQQGGGQSTQPGRIAGWY